MRDLTIKKVMNGYKVQVGCQELVFQRKDELIQELGRYLDNPGAVEEEYHQKYSMTTPQVQEAAVRTTRGMDELRLEQPGAVRYEGRKERY